MVSTASADEFLDPPEGVISWLPQVFGQVELTYEHARDLDLDSAVADDSDSVQAELTGGLFLQPSRYFSVNLEGKLTALEELRDQAPDEDSSLQFSVEQAYVRLQEPDWGAALIVGRQPFEDERRWLYDAELDAVRGSYLSDELALDLLASRKAVVDGSASERNTYILDATHGVGEQTRLGAFAILADDRDTRDDGLLTVGVRAFGRLDERLDFWIDLAHVRGREDGNDVRGYGFDLLAAFRFEAPFSPYLIGGLGYGSGDAEPDEGGDDAFRQTGLQENEVEIGGLVPVKYYGETFDPELSNLTVVTAGFGLHPIDEMSIDALFHYYRQNEALDELADSGIDAEPNGLDAELGSEIDLVVGYTGIDSLEIKGAFGYFMPGAAFGGDADHALSAYLELIYEF